MRRFGGSDYQLRSVRQVCKADHGPKTWAVAANSVVVVTRHGQAMTALDLAHRWESHRRAPVYFGVDGARKTPFIITAAHVVARAKAIEIVDISGVKSPAYLYAVDMRRDIAILQVDKTGPSIAIAKDEPMLAVMFARLVTALVLVSALVAGLSRRLVAPI